MAGPIELPAPDADTAKRWQDVMRTLRTGVNSDYLIKCGEDAHAVHKNIISVHSEVLSRACNGRFKASRLGEKHDSNTWNQRLTPSKEATEGVLDLVDDDPLAVTAMVDYIYLGNYTHTIMKSPLGIQQRSTYTAEFLPLHAEVYLLGDKYGLQGLQKTAVDNAMKTLKNYPDCVLSDEFKDTIDIIYSQEYLNKALDFRICLIDAMIKHRTCLDEGETEDKIRQYPAMSYDLGSKLRKNYHLGSIAIQCQVCSTVMHLRLFSDDEGLGELDGLCGHRGGFGYDRNHSWRATGQNSKAIGLVAGLARRDIFQQ